MTGQAEGESGEEGRRLVGRLSSERLWHEAVEEGQAEALGRERYEWRGEPGGDRNGDPAGTLRTGEGGLRGKGPQIRGQAAPDRWQLWNQVSTTSEVLQKLLGAM